MVVDNAYTRWFARGEATADEVRHLAVQFSVFSHLFIEAQLRKVINAGSLDTYRAGVQIQGVEIKKADPPGKVVAAFQQVWNPADPPPAITVHVVAGLAPGFPVEIDAVAVV